MPSNKYQYPNPNTPHKHCWHPYNWNIGEEITTQQCCLCGTTKQKEPKGYDAVFQKAVKGNY